MLDTVSCVLQCAGRLVVAYYAQETGIDCRSEATLRVCDVRRARRSARTPTAPASKWLLQVQTLLYHIVRQIN